MILNKWLLVYKDNEHDFRINLCTVFQGCIEMLYSNELQVAIAQSMHGYQIISNTNPNTSITDQS